ncbi:universal stress protein [Marinoscillum furvescens]|uniref:Nucleotide-binding universal stress UspA family protein n=1 Tax=Marinoscillum furvescens DSM 4134 TaxID=1122208 RepID=A0A3D9L228_MARFU|nr:universal stress protein [Marinoscillum furvescens]RED96216.1 nucleotide-binding universal stress UspA family protein [Marinoscillum furvescens DSM 4134]
MYKYNKIIVGLDHTEMDKDLISAASDICTLSGSRVVYFVNVIRDVHLPEKVQKEFPDLLDRAIADRKKELETIISEGFSCQDVEVVIHVMVDQGQVTKSILNFTTKEKIDLVILGRKNERKGGGVLINRVARRVGCSLLILPKGTRIDMSNILVATDYSEYSKSAMEKAVSLAKKSKTAEHIMVQNVYQVPVGYHYTGKSFDEFGDIMKDHAKKDYQKFVSDIDFGELKVKEIYSLDKDDDIISDIHRESKRRKASLIVIGAKGRTATTALFIGSKAEKLIQVNSAIPMLVVRPKNKKAGILDYIKEL